MSSAAAVMPTSECGTGRGWHGSHICSANRVYSLNSGSVTQWHSTGLTYILSALNSIKLWLLWQVLHFVPFCTHILNTFPLRSQHEQLQEYLKFAVPFNKCSWFWWADIHRTLFNVLGLLSCHESMISENSTYCSLCWHLTLNCCVWALKWCKKCRNITLYLADTAT